MGSWMLAVSYPKNNSGNGNDDDITDIPPTGGGNDNVDIYEESIIILDDDWNLNSLTIKSRVIDSEGFVNENDIFFTNFSKNGNDGNIRNSQFTYEGDDSKGYFKNGCYERGTTPSDDMYMKWHYCYAKVELINLGSRGYELKCFVSGSDSQEGNDGQGETIYLPVGSRTVDGKEILYIPKSGNWIPKDPIGEIIETTYTLE
jgi:hypothetical protein